MFETLTCPDKNWVCRSVCTQDARSHAEYSSMNNSKPWPHPCRTPCQTWPQNKGPSTLPASLRKRFPMRRAILRHYALGYGSASKVRAIPPVFPSNRSCGLPLCVHKARPPHFRPQGDKSQFTANVPVRLRHGVPSIQ